VSTHWNEVYDARASHEVSWFQPAPTTSLALLESLDVGPSESVVDVGAGDATLVDQLRARGFRDLTILDLSSSALARTVTRLGPDARDVVEVVNADVTAWSPPRLYDLWHDRAVLHFLDPPGAQRYVATLRDAVSARGAVIIGVFAPDGPTSCSGLPVTRYSAAELGQLLGGDFDVISQRRESHVTPWGAEQRFQWIGARRRAT
jgi:trans-aconitate methyltransferase